MFKQIYLFIHELIDIFIQYIHTFIHTYNVIEVLYPRENNFALEPIFIYIAAISRARFTPTGLEKWKNKIV